MRKNFLFIFLSLVAILCFSACSNTSKVNEEYFYQINSLIKNEDFYTAKVEDYKIVLYDSKNEPKKEIMFDDYNDNIQILNVRKEDSNIYFITSGSVDDEQGIIFINDDSNKILDGIKTIKRIGGNSYQYSTSE